MLQAGEVIQGKWSRQWFRVEKRLGIGANGEVYQVQTVRGQAAMKVCENASDIALEWGVLERVQAVDAFPKPMLMDDDASRDSLYFYIMEWVPGRSLDVVIPKLSTPELYEIAPRILEVLHHLHATGFAFCDLKPQNILVTRDPDWVVRFVDVGGITPFGRSVRQFTPYYDRAFWGLGSRQADAAYDLSALILLLICANGRPGLQGMQNASVEQRRRWLYKCIQTEFSSEMGHVFRDVLEGRILNSGALKNRWQTIQAVGSAAASSPRASSRASSSVRLHDWTEWLMWSSLAAAFTLTIVAWGTFFRWF